MKRRNFILTSFLGAIAGAVGIKSKVKPFVGRLGMLNDDGQWVESKEVCTVKLLGGHNNWDIEDDIEYFRNRLAASIGVHSEMLMPPKVLHGVDQSKVRIA